MQIIDQSGSAPIVFFNTMINKISGYTMWELMEKHGMDVDEYWPGEFLDFVGKRFLFKLHYSDYNINNNNHTYRCDAVNIEPAFVKHFKEGFLDDLIMYYSLDCFS
ncbi:replication protein A 70 kDa DNA-binding subunit B [Tanacetum coccineum]